MSDFITFDGEDYIDYIKTPEDLKKFERMKEIEKTELHKPSKECLNAVIEYDNLANDLKGLPRRKFIIVNNDAKLN